MTTARRICFDRLLSSDLNVPHTLVDNLGGLGPLRAISPLHKQWINGSTIKIGFMGGTAQQHQVVQSIAPQWTDYANLHFEFVDISLAQIRVSFDADDGAWSYIGTDNSSIPKSQATLNLGWLDQGVVLHEFGHAIGLAHEHQNPAGGIVWNTARVIADLAGPPNYWDEATTRHNVIDLYSADQINGTAFDDDSIMLYAFPGDWTLNMPQGTHENTTLSDQDKAFIASSKMYPKTAGPEIVAVDLPIWTPYAGAIGKSGEEDLYRVVITTAGTHIFETDGSTDVIMSLFGPGSTTKLVAKDDDSGDASNARIKVALQPGIYYLAIRHWSPTKTGKYQVQVLRQT